MIIGPEASSLLSGDPLAPIFFRLLCLTLRCHGLRQTKCFPLFWCSRRLITNYPILMCNGVHGRLLGCLGIWFTRFAFVTHSSDTFLCFPILFLRKPAARPKRRPAHARAASGARVFETTLPGHSREPSRPAPSNINRCFRQCVAWFSRTITTSACSGTNTFSQIACER